MSTPLRPFTPVTPGEILAEELKARGWSQSDLAVVLGRPVQAVNEIVTGKKAITPETAIALSQALGTSAEYWLNLESSYRLDLLYQRSGKKTAEVERRSRLFSKVPLKELMRLGWIKAGLDDLDKAEEAVCRFLEIDAIEDEPKLPFAARKAAACAPHSQAQTAWVCQVRHLARKAKAGKYARNGLTAAVTSLVKFSASEMDTRSVPAVLAGLGVRFVVVPHLKGTRTDGATAWLDEGSPIVAVSFRYDRMDWFWFTLLHELAHVLAGDGLHKAMIDQSLVGKDADATHLTAAESKADKAASVWLIPGDEMRLFIRRTKPYYSRGAILQFAATLGVHPAIIVGQLQKRGEIPHTDHRNLLVKVRHLLAAE
ncbi:MAG: HigA family addiction module antidote protein [Acidobacteria bacterium]|nr:HigA family addiction module antidote protein [Acidobacteriota bacterium]